MAFAFTSVPDDTHGWSSPHGRCIPSKIWTNSTAMHNFTQLLSRLERGLQRLLYRLYEGILAAVRYAEKLPSKARMFTVSKHHLENGMATFN